MGRRTFLLIASIVVAAIGTGLVAIYVNNADERAQAGEQLVNVYVAKETIAQGTPGSAVGGKVKQEPIPERLVADSAVTDLRTIAGQVTSGPIFPRQQIVTEMFGKESQAPVNVVTIDSGKVAVMVQMGEPARLAGLLQPGSQVAVFATSEEANQTPRLLFDRVTVISPGGTVTAATGKQVTTPTTTVTLELSPIEARQVIQATSAGSLYFVLLGSGTNLQSLASGDLSP